MMNVLTRTKSKIAAAIVCGIAMSISSVAFADEPLQTLKQLQNMNQVTSKLDELKAKNKDRMRAMKEAAIGIGAQHGYVSQMKVLKDFITSQQTNLDNNFDFASLMRLSGDKISGNYLLPAVIEEVKDAQVVSDDGSEFRSSGTVYRIIQKERLVTAPPNWREYLVWDLDAELAKPHELLMPKNPDEQALWSGWVTEGWKAGVIQAEQEMVKRLRNLGTDFNGMVRYTRLVIEGKATEAKVMAQHRAVVGGGDEMREADSIYRLSTPASLNSDAKNWKPIATDPRGSLRVPDEFTNMQ
ncbi:type IV secretory system conjugative DNA transfer family protein [Pseudomonas luteola]